MMDNSKEIYTMVAFFQVRIRGEDSRLFSGIHRKFKWIRARQKRWNELILDFDYNAIR